jgi:hypothetical protein
LYFGKGGEIKVIKKLLVAMFVVLGLLVVVGNSSVAKASHDTDSTSVRHAYRPYTNPNTRGMVARVDNFVPRDVNRLVCVEAFNVATGHKTHLGCLSIPMDSYNTTTGHWAFEFEAPTYWLAQGTYNVRYTYRDDNGNWNLIKSVVLTVQNGTFNNP